MAWNSNWIVSENDGWSPTAPLQLTESNSDGLQTDSNGLDANVEFSYTLCVCNPHQPQLLWLSLAQLFKLKPETLSVPNRSYWPTPSWKACLTKTFLGLPFTKSKCCRSKTISIILKCLFTEWDSAEQQCCTPALLRPFEMLRPIQCWNLK